MLTLLEKLKHSCASARLRRFRLPIAVSALLVFYLQTSASPSSESGYSLRSCWITFCTVSVQHVIGDMAAICSPEEMHKAKLSCCAEERDQRTANASGFAPFSIRETQ